MLRFLGSLTADWLTLAAAPAFLLMAILAAITGGHHAAAGDMTPMYLLMAAVHLAPWLRIGRQDGG